MAGLSNGGQSSKDTVRAYFDGQAGKYSEKTERGPLQIVRRMEAAAVMKAIGDVSGLNVIEIGSGAGHYTRRLLAEDAGHVWAIDLSARMLENLANPRITTINADAAAFQLGVTAPLIVSIGLLEFVPDPKAVLENAARHAEAGARLVLMVPRLCLVGHLYRYFHRRHGFPIHLFTADKLTRIAKSAGWEAVSVATCPPLSLVAAFRLA
ncbi:MAG: class I SAM-dependent methyltransferase [Proteobacteria bacterium]|nr:class I SAM-dependent methyltransferase [Pseudomonadota bacterium]